MKVAFFDRQLCERGSTVSLFDYAYHNIKCLNNESVIIHMKNPPHTPNEPDVVKKFKEHFTVYNADNSREIDEIIKKEKCDVFYQIAADAHSHLHTEVKSCKNVVHCIFECKGPRPWFSVVATISKDVFSWNEKVPVVPHMISLPKHNENMRAELNIPEDATVFGRYGGTDEFNLSSAHVNVVRAATENPDIYFLFVNTKTFLNESQSKNLKNIIFLPRIDDEFPQNQKVKFINTCDAMIHARQCGEAFGIALGEFNIFNKPIITCAVNRHNAHITTLGNKGIYYPGYSKEIDEKLLPIKTRPLKEILTSFNRNEMKLKDHIAYGDYTPENVMKQFQKVFLS
tara:strand:+ start:12408 stop:13433 length:1026 start_codon:yes stop_codon:yes gene_type:complete